MLKVIGVHIWLWVIIVKISFFKYDIHFLICLPRYLIWYIYLNNEVLTKYSGSVRKIFITYAWCMFLFPCLTWYVYIKWIWNQYICIFLLQFFFLQREICLYLLLIFWCRLICSCFTLWTALFSSISFFLWRSLCVLCILLFPVWWYSVCNSKEYIIRLLFPLIFSVFVFIILDTTFQNIIICIDSYF